MCANYRVGLRLQEFLDKFGVEPQEAWDFPEMDVRPTDPVPGVVRREDKNELRVFRWGLVPHWSDDIKVGVRMFNARSETLEEKAAFREYFHSRRCVLPLESFYEFDDHFKYRVSRRDGEPMGVAGLWAVNKRIGDRLESCTMITCEPNAVMATIHNRMPAILEPSEFSAWLDPSLTETEDLMEMLRPAPDDAIVVEKIGERKIPKRKPTTPSLLDGFE